MSENDASRIAIDDSRVGNCDIRTYMNYSVLNETKWNE